MKGKVIKLLKDNTGQYLHDLQVGKGFLNNIQKSLVSLTTLILKTLYMKKTPSSGEKTSSAVGEEICSTHQRPKTCIQNV